MWLKMNYTCRESEAPKTRLGALALTLSRKLLWWHQIMCDSFARVLHLSQDLIPDYSLTCWTSSQRQKITLLPFRERIRNQKFEIHWLIKSVCIHYSNVSIALMLFKNNLITKFHLSDWIGYKFWLFFNVKPLADRATSHHDNHFLVRYPQITRLSKQLSWRD